jgi:steroid 5-alpha reductase family enzyme
MVTNALLPGWLVLSTFFAALWAAQRRSANATSVDVGWAASLGCMAILCALVLPGEPARRALVGAMGGLWSARLAWHLDADRVRKKSEDGRYAALRASWGADAQRNFFWFYQAQAALAALLALPFAALAARPGSIGPADAAGAALWLISVAGEAAADRTLAAFRSDPANKGRVCREGLWRYSRHPNYFFEWTHWLAYAAMAPADWRVWISAAVMLFFLLRVTGIPATEEQALRTRGEDYRRYRLETPMFVPWFPRKAAPDA